MNRTSDPRNPLPLGYVTRCYIRWKRWYQCCHIPARLPISHPAGSICSRQHHLKLPREHTRTATCGWLWPTAHIYICLLSSHVLITHLIQMWRHAHDSNPRPNFCGVALTAQFLPMYLNTPMNTQSRVIYMYDILIVCVRARVYVSINIRNRVYANKTIHAISWRKGTKKRKPTEEKTILILWLRHKRLITFLLWYHINSIHITIWGNEVGNQ